LSFISVGDEFRVTSRVRLGRLRPDEVAVQLFYGHADSKNQITQSQVENMEMVATRDDGVFEYSHTMRCTATGRYGFAVRAVPSGEDWKTDTPGFVTWAGD
jgi:starch phosphorylase